jgi:hypothetical protein
MNMVLSLLVSKKLLGKLTGSRKSDGSSRRAQLLTFSLFSVKNQ